MGQGEFHALAARRQRLPGEQEMPRLSSISMTAVLVGYGLVLLALTWFAHRKGGETAEGFLVADRRVGVGLGSASILATWIYACSLYIPAQCGYRYGIAGPLYYSLGGALMVGVFALLVARIRAIVPHGHTLPEYLGARFGRAVHVLLTAKFLLFMPVSLYFNLTVAGYLITAFSPLPYEVGLLLVGLTFTSYSLVSGLKASILTDYVQLVMISLLGVVIAPVVFHNAGGATGLAAALPRLGEKGSLFSPTALVMLAVPWFIESATGSLSNCALWQRVWAIKPADLKRAFLVAGLGWFPYSFTFGVFGVIAIACGVSSHVGKGNDITPLVAARFLSPVLSLLFVVMVVSAAASTCDSLLAAFSSITMTDVYKCYLRPSAPDSELLLVGRLSMLLCTAVGVRLALLNIPFIDAIWIMGAFGKSLTFPLVASLYWSRVESVGFIGGTLLGSAAGVAANLLTRHTSPLYATIGIVVSVAVGALVCTVCALIRNQSFDFETLQERIRQFA